MGNIAENNKLIALFMGAKSKDNAIFHLESHECWLPMHGICRWDTVGIGMGSRLHYHDSWDWLMPVVDNIESLGYDFNIFLNGVIISNVKHPEVVVFDNVSQISYDKKIELVYHAVTGFIKWHNAQTK